MINGDQRSHVSPCIRPCIRSWPRLSAQVCITRPLPFIEFQHNMAEKLAPEKRHNFIHNGQKVFEWDQTLDEVNIYIDLPPKVPKNLFHAKIQCQHLEVGIKGSPPYLNHNLAAAVKTDSSFWTIEDETLHVTLQKREKGHTWSSPFLGQGGLDPYSADLEQKRLMLQRFQEENPGFDFSQAQFSGTCPDPKNFMGGIRSD